MTGSFNPSAEFHLKQEGVSDQELGEKMAKVAFQIVNDDFFADRNRLIKENIELSQGTQSMKEYMSYLGIDGKQAYVNLDWSPPMIAPKFMEVLMGNFMKRFEKPRCTSVDPVSIKKKKIARDLAEFRMLEPELSKEAEAAIGKYPTRDSFEPKSYDELDLFFNIDYRTPEEVLMERGVSNVLHENDWKDKKRVLLSHIRDAGYGVTYTRAKQNGQIVIEVIHPADFFSSFSEKNDFGDAFLMGHKEQMKIYQVRERFPELTEEEVFDMAKKSKDCESPSSMRFRSEYNDNSKRPYDDYGVIVLFFEVRTVRPTYFVERKTDNGRTYISKKQSKPHQLGEDKSLIKKDMEVIYQGVFVEGARKLVHFKLLDRMIKPSNPKELSKAYSSYSVHMPNNVNMKNISLIQRIRPSIRMMTLVHMKLQQLIARMRPSGVAVDVANLKEVDLGQGEVKPLELQRVYDQTGNVFYSSVDEDGERKNMPISELANAGSVAQIKTLIETYNFYLNKIRDEIGINEYREGSSVNPKLGLGVLQQQIKESNNATDFIYDAYIDLAEQTIKKVGILLHDSVVYGGKAYREYFAEANVGGTYFDMKMELLPDDVEKAYIEQMIQTSLSNNLIDFADAFKIRRIDNVKLQEIYLDRAKKEKEQKDRQFAKENSEMNAQIQERSAAAKAESDAAIEQRKTELKVMLESKLSELREKEAMQKFVHEALMESFKLGKPIDGEIKDIIDGYFQAQAEEAEMMRQQAAEQAKQQFMEQAASQGASPDEIEAMMQEQE